MCTCVRACVRVFIQNFRLIHSKPETSGQLSNCSLDRHSSALGRLRYLAVCAYTWSGDAALPVNNAGHNTEGNVVRRLTALIFEYKS